jgi:precorrin-2 dehydrogenase/sirohydrochlorin ferrochelatase
VLVVGGGEIAERKVDSLLEAEAVVTVVSPDVTARLLEYANAGRLKLHRRRFLPSDIEGVLLVISATDDAAAQQQVASLAASRNVLVNTVDKPELCTFIVPAVLKRGDITLAISTSGASPSLAAALRRRLDPVLTEDMARAAAVLRAVRHEVHERFAGSAERKKIFDRIIESGIIDWIAACDDTAALARVRRLIDEVD